MRNTLITLTLCALTALVQAADTPSNMAPAAGPLASPRAAIAAGCEPHLLLCGQLSAHAGPNALPLPPLPEGTRVHTDLAAFADHLLALATEKN